MDVLRLRNEPFPLLSLTLEEQEALCCWKDSKAHFLDTKRDT